MTATDNRIRDIAFDLAHEARSLLNSLRSVSMPVGAAQQLIDFVQLVEDRVGAIANLATASVATASEGK